MSCRELGRWTTAPSCLLLKKAATQIGTYRVDSSACFTGLPQIPKQLTNPTQAKILTARIAQIGHKKLFAPRFLLWQTMWPHQVSCSSHCPKALGPWLTHMAPSRAQAGNHSTRPHSQLPHHYTQLVTTSLLEIRQETCTQQLPQDVQACSTDMLNALVTNWATSSCVEAWGGGVGEVQGELRGEGETHFLCRWFQSVSATPYPLLALPAHTTQQEPGNPHIRAQAAIFAISSLYPHFPFFHLQFNNR